MINKLTYNMLLLWRTDVDYVSVVVIHAEIFVNRYVANMHGWNKTFVLCNRFS